MSYETPGGGDSFKTKIYKEFEKKLYRFLHISLGDFIRIFEGDREPPIESFSEVYNTPASSPQKSPDRFRGGKSTGALSQRSVKYYSGRRMSNS